MCEIRTCSKEATFSKYDGAGSSCPCVSGKLRKPSGRQSSTSWSCRWREPAHPLFLSLFWGLPWQFAPWPSPPCAQNRTFPQPPALSCLSVRPLSNLAQCSSLAACVCLSLAGWTPSAGWRFGCWLVPPDPSAGRRRVSAVRLRHRRAASQTEPKMSFLSLAIISSALGGFWGSR